MTFAKNLRSKRKALGLTQQEIADVWGIKSVNVSAWERGVGMPEAAKLQALAKRLETTVSELMGEPARPAMGGRGAKAGWSDGGDELGDTFEIIGRPRLIPIVGRVEAGEDGLLHIDDYGLENPDGYLYWFTTCTEAYGLRIRGESMSPRYFPGEYVGVDPCAEVLPSDEVIVLRADGRRMIKRLMWKRDEQVCFESVNKAFQNVILDISEIAGMHLVMGRVPKSAFRPNAN